MDQYRGDDGPFEASITESVSDEMDESNLQGMERRLVLRLLKYWRGICGDAEFPSFDDVDPNEMPTIWESAFVLDILGHEDDPVFRAFGPVYASYSPTLLNNIKVSQVAPDTLIEKSVEIVQEVIRKQVPISRGGEFIKPNGVKALYRGIILPMSDDGETISGLLGAANCRELSGDDD